MSHTPGPWDWDYGDIGELSPRPYCDVYCDDAENEVIAAIEPCINQHANARLIAAAPDMYEALLLARDAIANFPRSLGYDITHLRAIEAAIAKAENKE